MLLKNLEDGNMKPTIITIGNGRYNIAADMIASGIFSDFKLIVCDTDAEDLKHNSANADCSFLLDNSADTCPFKNYHFVEPIVNEITDVYYLVAALGGKTSYAFVPAIAFKAYFGYFSWQILSTPADFEGDIVKKRARYTINHLLSLGDMKLIQDNNKLSSIPNLALGEMNKPIVETLISASKIDIRKIIRQKDYYDEFIPEPYRDTISLWKTFFKYPRKEDIS